MTSLSVFDDIRTVLLITLAVLVVVVAFRRFRQYVQLKHAPVPQHVELRALEVMYHPPRLRVQLSMPFPTEILPAMLNQAHLPLLVWPAVQAAKGELVLELPLPLEGEGSFFFEIATSTQRTERRFIVRHA